MDQHFCSSSIRGQVSLPIWFTDFQNMVLRSTEGSWKISHIPIWFVPHDMLFQVFFSTIWPGHSNNGVARDNPSSYEPATANSSTAISHSTDNKNRRSANNDDLSKEFSFSLGFFFGAMIVNNKLTFVHYLGAQIAVRGLKMLLEKCVNIG